MSRPFFGGSIMGSFSIWLICIGVRILIHPYNALTLAVAKGEVNKILLNFPEISRNKISQRVCFEFCSFFRTFGFLHPNANDEITA